MIQFEHVSKVFGKNQILKDVNFTIDQGNFVTIIGASGCGKTTTLKMINRLIKPTTGEIYIGGENIRDKDILQLRRSMGYVIQQTGLFSHMTIRENIEIIPRLSKADPERTRTRTLELMDLVGMDPDQYLDRYPTELSGGQQQRIGVARAFAMDPEIILMDEPFSALDPITRTQLQDELLGLQEELHKTIVFVTHDMDEAVKIADKICVMDKGKILQYDEPEQLLKNPCNEFVAQFVGKNRIWSSPEFIKARDIMIEPSHLLPAGTEPAQGGGADALCQGGYPHGHRLQAPAAGTPARHRLSIALGSPAQSPLHRGSGHGSALRLRQSGRLHYRPAGAGAGAEYLRPAHRGGQRQAMRPHHPQQPDDHLEPSVSGQPGRRAVT